MEVASHYTSCVQATPGPYNTVKYTHLQSCTYMYMHIYHTCTSTYNMYHIHVHVHVDADSLFSGHHTY